MTNQRPYRIIISGGGTGGHIYPAIAIANTLKEIHPDTEFLFVGAEGKMEMQKVPQAGYRIIGLPITGLQRKLTAGNLLFPVKVLRSLMKARSVIDEFKPDIAVGVGGYASGPLLYAAAGKGIPTLIQEQNSYAGLTNKWLAGKARTICVAYENMDAFFPAGKIKLTGNPVRKDILNADAKKGEAYAHFNLAAGKPAILIIGGSLGARTINESIKAALPVLAASECQVIWQTGKFYFEDCRKAAEGIANVRVYDFIGAMDLAYGAADVVISRAGALSISELCLAAKPAILVPSPNVSEDHQTKNALSLVRNDAALMVKDAEAKEKLVPVALELLKNESRKTQLSANIRQMGRPDAARQISEEILRLIRAR